MIITGILHTSFLTSDLARSRAFYEGVLGLRPDPERPAMSYEGMWYDVAPNQQIHLLLLPDPEAGLQRPAYGGRDRHVALAVSDLGQLIARLERAGIACTLSSSGRCALFCRDPDGNALEFIENG
ncbi:MAG: Glyoxalase/bleomycin resistance protein/dioxygenase [Candidatus Gallionella acididurans]|uniref:Glyoxalase/bleomycin resistance protein/dioxygenase n=1 Tax=Candidatus Gallionella acididurans TaxID=1796491 RepID=A0A139BVX8_9PROT|nr:MAG: Glyoxalase/bleomycin resistance protein/dioxygenase [Candidatus Gallionella acididurans]